ncbi:hypothetical protein D9M70_487570 [compost metagenome]
MQQHLGEFGDQNIVVAQSKIDDTTHLSAEKEHVVAIDSAVNSSSWQLVRHCLYCAPQRLVYPRDADTQCVALAGGDLAWPPSGHKTDNRDELARHGDRCRTRIRAEGRGTGYASGSKRLHRAERALKIKRVGAALEQGNDELTALGTEKEGSLRIAIGNADHRGQAPKAIGHRDLIALGLR